MFHKIVSDGDYSKKEVLAFPVDAISFPSYKQEDTHVLLEGEDFFSMGEIIERMNQVYYPLRGGDVFTNKDFVTRVSSDSLTSVAEAEDLYRRLIELVAKGVVLPDRINIAEYGIGNGNFAAKFLDHFQSIDKHGFYNRLSYSLVDFSQKMLEDACSSGTLKSHVDIGVARFVHIDDFHPAEGDLFNIRFNELLDDFPGVQLIEKVGDKYYEVNGRFTINTSRTIRTKNGREVSWQEFRDNYWNAGVTKLRELNPSFLLSIRWEEKLAETPIDLDSSPAGEFLREMLGTLGDGRFPINLGSLQFIQNLLTRLDKKCGGYIRFFDYSLTNLAEYSMNPNMEKVRQYYGNLTVDINIPYLFYYLQKQEGLEVVVGAQDDFISDYLSESHGVVRSADLGWRILELAQDGKHSFIRLNELSYFNMIRELSEALSFRVKNPKTYIKFINELHKNNVLTYPLELLKFLPSVPNTTETDIFLANIEYQLNFKLRDILDRIFNQGERTINPEYQFNDWVTEKAFKKRLVADQRSLESFGLLPADIEKLVANILATPHKRDFHYMCISPRVD